MQAGVLAGRLDRVLMADQENGGNARVGFQRAFDSFNDDPATVVATHDIHCDSHR